MAVEITGSGYNSKVKLYNIHQGNGYFRKDTSTTHSQVKLLQSALTDLGYDTQETHRLRVVSIQSAQ